MRLSVRLTSLVLLLGAAIAVPACTSLVLCAEEGPVFAANLDNRLQEGLIYVNKRGLKKSGWETSSNGARAEWTAKYGSVTFNLAGYQIAWAGMNEAGLVMSTMSLPATRYPGPDQRPPLEGGFWMQYQLDNSATIDDVIAGEAVVRMGATVDHYLVCDAGGEVAVIEFLRGEMVVHRGDALPFPVLTNHTYRDLVTFQRWWAFKRFFSRWYPPGNPSLRRFQLAAQNAEEFDPAREQQVEAALRTLREVSGQAVDGTPTQWSIVFDVPGRRVLFRTRTREAVRSLDFRSLDFGPDTPVLMMNIHTDISGDAAGALLPYSHEMTLAHYRRFFHDYGSNVSEDLTRRLVGHFEGFHPAW